MLFILLALVQITYCAYTPDSPECVIVEPPPSCVLDGSITESCGSCGKTKECGNGMFCSPYLKNCVASSNTSCYFPIAQCKGGCSSDDNEDLGQCNNCLDANFPDNWVKCTNGEPGYNKYSTDGPTPLGYIRKEVSGGSLAVDDEVSIQAQCQHNMYRAIAGLGLLEWDAQLAEFATERAKDLKANNNMRMKHSTNEQRSDLAVFSYVGENIAWSECTWSEYTSGGMSQNDMPGKAMWAADAWYDEIKYYQYGANFDQCAMRLDGSGREQVGHFTQMMWADTTHIGCDWVLADDGVEVLVVCYYAPGGNIEGQNVFSESNREKLDNWSGNDYAEGLPACPPPNIDGVCKGQWGGECAFPSNVSTGFVSSGSIDDCSSMMPKYGLPYCKTKSDEWDLCSPLAEDPDCV